MQTEPKLRCFVAHHHLRNIGWKDSPFRHLWQSQILLVTCEEYWETLVCVFLQRDNVVKGFRSGKIWVLVCTELMGRGIDFKGVNIVVNFDFPTSAISYIHRIGKRWNRYSVASHEHIAGESLLVVMQHWKAIFLSIFRKNGSRGPERPSRHPLHRGRREKPQEVNTCCHSARPVLTLVTSHLLDVQLCATAKCAPKFQHRQRDEGSRMSGAWLHAADQQAQEVRLRRVLMFTSNSVDSNGKLEHKSQNYHMTAVARIQVSWQVISETLVSTSRVNVFLQKGPEKAGQNCSQSTNHQDGSQVRNSEGKGQKVKSVPANVVSCTLCVRTTHRKKNWQHLKSWPTPLSLCCFAGRNWESRETRSQKRTSPTCGEAQRRKL